MPRFNVKYKEKWACFSSICDNFVTGFMDKDSYEEWRKIEYGESNYKPLEQYNIIDMKEAVSSIRLNRSREESLECLYNAGLSKKECEQLMFDMEAEYFVPKLKDNKVYICPNCKEIVEKGQTYCKQENCEQELVWIDN